MKMEEMDETEKKERAFTAIQYKQTRPPNCRWRPQQSDQEEMAVGSTQICCQAQKQALGSSVSTGTAPAPQHHVPKSTSLCSSQSFSFCQGQPGCRASAFYQGDTL